MVGKQDEAAVIHKHQLNISPFGLTSRYLNLLTEFSHFHLKNFPQQKLDLRARNTDWMRRETQPCHGSYGTNSLLAIKINAVLETNINSSSADKREGTDNLKTFSEFCQ